MDIHSIEFYVLALFVAFALMGVIFGRSERTPARTHIEAFEFDKEALVGEDHWVRFTGRADGMVLIERQGLELCPGETVNLVATIVDDKATLIEKRGVDGSAAEAPVPCLARAVVDWLPTRRLHIRYESEVTGEWGLLAFTNRETALKQCELRH